MTAILIRVAILAAIALNGIASGQRAKADCHMQQIDGCLLKLEKYSQDPNSADLLKTADGIQEICKASLGSGRCLKQYMSKCGTPTHRELHNYFHDQFVKSMNDFCGEGPQRSAFLSESPCIVDRVLKQQQYKEKCVHSFLATLDRLTPHDDATVKINTACCSFNRWSNCMYTLINKECGGNAKKRFEDFIRNNLGTSANQLCNAASFKFSSKKCQRTYAPPGTKPRGGSSQNPIGKYILSYMGFLIQ